MRLFTALLIITFCTACQSKHLIEIDGQAYKVSTPPGMTSLEGNLFIDKAEMANIDYREYLYWMARVHGRQSEIYQAALPDTSVWKHRIAYKEPLIESYFRHPSHDSHPVVGISHDQAVKYASWRTSVVAESILIEKDFLVRDYNQNTENVFSWQRFVAGEEGQLLRHGSLLFPVFRLPSQEEWELAANKFIFSDKPVEASSFTNEDYHSFFILSSSDQQPSWHDQHEPQPPTVGYPFKTRGRYAYHLIGNVAEITAQEGIAVGGSWQHTIEESLPGQIQIYEAPQNWLGFRCVAKWVRVEF